MNSCPLKNIGPLVASRFSENIPILPMAERLKYFLKHWAKSKNDPTTLETVQGYISLLLMSQEETDLIDQEIREMVSRNAISNTQGKNYIGGTQSVQWEVQSVYGLKRRGNPT